MSMYPYEPETSLEKRILRLSVKLGNGRYNEAAVSTALAELDENNKEENMQKICRDLASAIESGGEDHVRHFHFALDDFFQHLLGLAGRL